MKENSPRYVITRYLEKACAIMVIASSLPCLAVSDSKIGHNRRLAILSSEAIQKSGLSDLMIVQMQELPNVELVERDLLRKVMNEMALSMMLGADQAENRRKTGALLKADMLILLSQEKTEEQQVVRIVISECSNGARLRIAWIPSANDDLEKVCSDLVEIVGRTLEQFKTGVKQIIGVSHFISRNLVHDYDHLQAGYVYLLQNALSSSPGVAVIEVEEARSIARENELTGDMNLDRMVPLFVEGEFRVERNESENKAKVHLKIRISDSTKLTKQIEREDLAFDKVGAFITDDVALEILKLSKSPSVKILDINTQLQVLIKNADEFARFGAWKHAADLREAAVLLKPDCVEQRIKLINEYYVARRKGGTYVYSYGKTRHRKWMSNSQAAGLSGQTFYGLPASAKQYKIDFLLTVYPKILDLEPTNSDPNNMRNERRAWYGTLVSQIQYRGCPNKDDLEIYMQLHNNLPEDMGSSRHFVWFLKDHAKPAWRRRGRGNVPKPYPDEYFTEQEFLDFITAMSHSSKPLSSFYGRFALLLYEYHLRRKQMKVVGDLYDDVEQLANKVKKHKFSIFQISWPCKSDCLYEEIRNLQDQIEQCMQEEDKSMSTSKAP
ncbi:MAG: hypothetical protein ACYTDW_05670 [Planctomycetota bacterium]